MTPELQSKLQRIESLCRSRIVLNQDEDTARATLTAIAALWKIHDEAPSQAMLDMTLAALTEIAGHFDV